jgi:hypothetical protein
MIKANDLRVGNLVYVVDKESTPQKQPIQVNLTWMQIPEALEPIPFTPEVIKRLEFYYGVDGCAFREDGGLVVYENVFFSIKLIESKYYLVASIEEYSSMVLEVKYLHQLQNLFFALTGNELELNLSEKV